MLFVCKITHFSSLFSTREKRIYPRARIAAKKRERHRECTDKTHTRTQKERKKERTCRPILIFPSSTNKSGTSSPRETDDCWCSGIREE